MPKELSEMKVAVIATNGVEKSELTEPVRALKDAGAEVRVLSLDTKPITLFQHREESDTYPVDFLIEDADPDEFDALLLPGGALNADTLRAEPAVLDFIREMDSAGKPLAAICHAPWELISANVVSGRCLTSYHAIKDDLVNAGAHWEDREVVRDGNWVTSRRPDDLPAFNKAIIALFARKAVGARR